MRQVAGSDPHYPNILFFYQGNVADGQEFFHKFWPAARAVADKAHTFYQAFGIQRVGIKDILAPEVAVCGLRASAKGNNIGRTIGDPWLMPGLFLVQGKQIIWQHNFRHIGDHPEFAAIARQVPTTAV